MFASHSWPRWGNDRIQEVLRAQRDAYANLNNQALHYANRGVTINEIHNVYEVPKSLQQQWAARSYHGDVQNNVARRDQPLPRSLRRQPGQPDPAVAEGFGAAVRGDDGRLGEDHRQGQGADGAGQVPARHRDPQQAGVRRAAQPAARRLLADAFEQLGYRAESTSVRNSFLQGAYELRNGLPGGVPPRSTGPDVVRAMSTEQWLDFVGISMDPKKAEGIAFIINLVDAGQRREVRRRDEQRDADHDQGLPGAEAGPHRDREPRRPQPGDDGAGVVRRPVKAGKAKFEGNRAGFDQLRSILVPFTPDFEIMPGTAPKKPTLPPKPFEVRGLDQRRAIDAQNSGGRPHGCSSALAPSVNRGRTPRVCPTAKGNEE